MVALPSFFAQGAALAGNAAAANASAPKSLSGRNELGPVNVTGPIINPLPSQVGDVPMAVWIGAGIAVAAIVWAFSRRR